MDWAVNEAIFRSRRTGLTLDTLRLWRGSPAVVLGTPSSFEDDVDRENCIKNGVEIVRTISVSPNVLYYDTGSLNFAFAIDTSKIKQLMENYQPVLSEYQFLNECIAMGLHRKFGVALKSDFTGVYVKDRILAESLQAWFYNYLLFQGTIHINTNLKIYSEVTRSRKQPATLSIELGKEICVEDVINALVQGFEKRLGVNFNEQNITEDEHKLIQKLYRVKYNLDKWNASGYAPFLIGMGKTTIEVFVAYPPTSKCRQLIDLVKNVTSDLQNEVEVRVWMRGRGIYQHGPNPEISPVLKSAEKNSTLPAIIVNGELKFSESIPSKEDLRKAIIEAL